jgi:hypothetical protein
VCGHAQDTFEEAIQENMELFDMSRIDATLEALTQFRAQGVNLDNILLPEVCTAGSHSQNLCSNQAI